MTEHITASPLTWPDGWTRTKSPERSRFGKWQKPVSIAVATTFVLEELRRMGIGDWNVIISTDLRLRQDGLPYSNQREPDDKGASVWWKDGDEQRVIALDKYDRIADNIYAIGKTIEAMRGIERWGGGEILERTFTGFTALPNPDAQPSWRDVLDYYGDDIDDANTAYKVARAVAHPDKGGDTDRFYLVNQAWEQAEQELR
jgi:hypothetical protein